jgi:4-amino-4-deoxy-L-arabinose transferase-like glycosyltransferase
MSLAAFLMAMLLLLTLKLTQEDGRRAWLGYGVLWALAALTNPAVLSIFPFALVWLAINRIRSRRPVFLSLTITIVAFLVCASPWILRNNLVLGKPAFFRDNFWFELHLGNYHDSNGLDWGGRHPA